MAKTFEELSGDDYKFVSHTASGETFAAGDLKIFADVAGFTIVDVADGEKATFITGSPRVKVKKRNTEAWTAGAKVGYSNANAWVQLGDSDHKVGYVKESAEVTDEYGFIVFEQSQLL